MELMKINEYLIREPRLEILLTSIVVRGLCH
jgi:hypothetical protein